MLIISKITHKKNSLNRKLHSHNEVGSLCKLKTVKDFDCILPQKLKTFESYTHVANTAHTIVLSPYDKSDFASINNTQKPP